jgi:hypothetical protein
LAYGKATDWARKVSERGLPGPPLPVIRSAPFGDRTVFWLDNAQVAVFPLAWCANGHELVLSATPQNIKAYLARGNDYQSLAAAPEVARQFSGASSPAMLGCLDTPRIFELLYPFAPLVLQGLKGSGLDFDVSLLPSAPSIRRHLRPELAVLRRTPAGIEQTTYECLPEAGVGAAVAAGLVLAAGMPDSENPLPPAVAVPAKPSSGVSPLQPTVLPGPSSSTPVPPTLAPPFVPPPATPMR